MDVNPISGLSLMGSWRGLVANARLSCLIVTIWIACPFWHGNCLIGGIETGQGNKALLARSFHATD